MEKKKLFLYGIVSVSILLQALSLLIQIQCITFADVEIWNQWLSVSNLYNIVYGICLYAAVLALIYGSTGKLAIGYVILELITAALGIANNMKWNSLGECITFSDFSKWKEALGVAGNVPFQAWEGTRYAWILAAVTVCLWILIDRRLSGNRKKDTESRKGRFLVSVLFCVVVCCFAVRDGRQSEVDALAVGISCEESGPVVYWVKSLFQENMRETYTVGQAVEEYETYVNAGMEHEDEQLQYSDEAVCPNIIVIMSETFYDVNRLKGAVDYSENPMRVFDEVKQEGISGDLYVNAYGGSTHFTEFEFLTGWNTKGMSSGSIPYKEYFSENQPSFASYLKELGYDTLAIHPYNGKFWNRYVAYPRLGFDRFIDRSRMTYQEKCGYISDESLTKEIIKQYEEKEDGKPLFCFAVSIANHIAILNGEEKENSPNDITVTYDETLRYGENKKRWIQEYVSGIEKSGEALKELTDYLKTEKEPTIVVFFGDHAPGYALEQLEANQSDESLAYSTPYLVWGNYDWCQETQGESVCAYYLSTYLVELLHMPLTKQNYYNMEKRKEYPVDSRYMIKEKSGKGYADFSKQEKQDYYYRALEWKKQTDTLLENPSAISDIWTPLERK